MGYKASLPKGTGIFINGLAVTLIAEADFTINDADDADEAAVLCHIKNVPCDLSHVDPVKGVNVTYTIFDGSRVETPVEVVEAPAKVKAKK